MSDRPNEQTPGSNNEGGSHSQHRKILPEDRFPPELSVPEHIVLWTARIFMLLALCYLGYICLNLLLDTSVPQNCIVCTYIALSVILIGLVTDRLLLHKKLVHKARTEDRSEIEALIQEANNVQQIQEANNVQQNENNNQNVTPNDYNILQHEILRLTVILGPEAWTDYQTLTINQLLVKFLSIEDLKARARSNLVELEEYAEGDTFSYNARLYKKWEERIHKDIECIDQCKDDKQKNISANKLRADLRSLLEHIVDYESNWAQGKTIVNGIRICGSTAVVVFILMGLLGVIYPVPDTVVDLSSRFGILHWGFLGSAGATTSVLLGLRNSNAVEVGNTEGFQELWRANFGAILGFVPGILIFSALAGGLINDGAAVPNPNNAQAKDVYLSIIWAIVAGMGFGNVFQRVRSAVDSWHHHPEFAS